MRFFSGLTEYRCLADLKVGVLGVGQIGKTVAKTFAGKRDKAKGRLKNMTGPSIFGLTYSTPRNEKKYKHGQMDILL